MKDTTRYTVEKTYSSEWGHGFGVYDSGGELLGIKIAKPRGPGYKWMMRSVTTKERANAIETITSALEDDDQ